MKKGKKCHQVWYSLYSIHITVKSINIHPVYVVGQTGERNQFEDSKSHWTQEKIYPRKLSVNIFIINFLKTKNDIAEKI